MILQRFDANRLNSKIKNRKPNQKILILRFIQFAIATCSNPGSRPRASESGRRESAKQAVLQGALRFRSGERERARLQRRGHHWAEGEGGRQLVHRMRARQDRPFPDCLRPGGAAAELIVGAACPLSRITRKTTTWTDVNPRKNQREPTWTESTPRHSFSDSSVCKAEFWNYFSILISPHALHF